MKTYNRSLDCITLAMAYAAKGNVTASAKMFQQAMAQPDVKRAIATLEASNKQAFKATAAAGKKQVRAGDDLDMGDEEDLNSLVGDDEGGEEEEFSEDEVEEAAFDEDDEEDEEFDGAEFAKVLASLTKPAKRKTSR